MKCSALCIDMDGVLLDTERLALRCWQQAAKEFDLVISNQLFAQVIGRNLRDTRAIFCANLGQRFDFDQVRARRLELGATFIAQNGMPVKTGAEALLRYTNESKLPCAIVTSTDSEEAHHRLRSARIPYEHSILIGGEMAAKGKPEPDLYLAACTRLLVPPDLCLAIEDSIPGIYAAAAAGAQPILIPDIVSPDEATLAKTFKVCSNLAEALVIVTQCRSSTERAH